jgi:hypothetical protein
VERNLNSLINHFSTSSHPTPNPHPTVNSVPIPLIAGLHIYKQSKFIAVWVNFVCQLRIRKLSQNFRRPCPPAMRLNDDMCRWTIVSLKNIVCLQLRRTICNDELAILSSRLVHVSKSPVESMRRLTKTIPDPQDPDHMPPVKEIQFRCPRGVGPTEMRGLSVTDMRKSRLRVG